MIPPIIYCFPDSKLLSFSYFLYRKEKISATDFFLWAEERLLRQMQGSEFGVEEMMQVISGLGYIPWGSANNTQKQIIDVIDSGLEKDTLILDTPKVYVNLLHAIAKLEHCSPKMKTMIEQRFPSMLAKVKENGGDLSLGVMCMNACSLPLSTAIIKSLVYPLIASGKHTFEPKHTLCMMYSVAEPEIFDEKIFECLKKSVEDRGPFDSGFESMLTNAIEKADRLRNRNKES